MKSYLKANIRLEKISARSNKKTYKGLNDIEKRIVKLVERKYRIDKDLYGFRGYYVMARYIVDTPDNKPIEWEKIKEKDIAFFERFCDAIEGLEKINKRLEKYSEKEINDAMVKYNSLNNKRFYGGSY